MNLRANGGHAIGDGNRCQAAALIERKRANGGHTIGDNQICHQGAVQIQILSIVKRVGIRTAKRNLAPRRYIRDVYTRQAAATIKRQPLQFRKP